MTLREPKSSSSSSSSSDRLAEVSSPATPRDIIGEMSIKAFQAEHANDPVDPHATVRFSQLDMDAATKPLHVEIERLKGAASPATPALDWKRLIKLARRQADEDHMKVFEGTGSDEGHNPHYAECAHPDCVLVRLADVARLPASQEGWNPISTAPKGIEVVLANDVCAVVADWAYYCVHNAPKFSRWLALPLVASLHQKDE